MSKLVFGADEAGRGAVVGPLVIAAAVVEDERHKNLKNLGVKDSKKLSREERDHLEKKIKDELEDFAMVKLPADRIDRMMKRKSLNRIELESMADLVNALRPREAIIDATEVKTEKIEREIEALLDKDLEVKVNAENYADENYPVVSSASILAKVVRDSSVKDLERNLGTEIGNGYPSDGRTKSFLKRCLRDEGKFPECVRESWTTSRRLIEERSQGDLSKFCEGEEGT